MSQPRTRQELYDQIRATSKDSFILSEMHRLGFLNANEGMPTFASELLLREGALSRELNELAQKQYRYNQKEAMLKEMRKTRMDAAKKRRVETKQKHEKKRVERAAVWAEKKENAILYLGEGVSGGLNNTIGDAEKLAKFGLPHFEDLNALAKAMGLSVGQIRFLTFNRKISEVSHYKHFYMAKKSGGQRLISAPMPRLKNAQYWILENLLYKVKVTNNAHGFVPTRSILTNAAPHIGKNVVINLDLKDFFPTLDYKRVKGLFSKIGYSEQIATIFALFCTEPEIDVVEIDGKTYYAQKGERFLPQGAPTSPAITNLICYKLDQRFEGLAARFGFTYTRYADDLTFSADEENSKSLNTLLWAIRQIIGDEGFTLHPDKLKIMRNGNRQEVTGVVVNQKLGVERDTLRKFRALLHQIEKTGIKDKKWGNGHIVNTITGYANFVAMVKPEQGAKLKAQVKELLDSEPIRQELIEIAGLTNNNKNTEQTILVEENTESATLDVLLANEEWWNVL